jgi:acyl dehydratase
LFKGGIMVAKICFFEDYDIGQEGETWTRTVGEPDINTFACITCDYSREHLDRHSAASSPYGSRIAHGLLGASLVMGTTSLTSPQIVGRGVPEAYLYGFEITYRGAIKIDDTIRTKWRVADKTDDPTQLGFGLVKTTFQVINQENEGVYEGNISVKVRKGEAKDERLSVKPGILWEFKEFILDPEKFYYMEDFAIGEGKMSEGRTITEADIVNFAGLTGDYDPLYVDASFAQKHTFGERIVPPMLPFCIAMGLWVRDGNFLRTKIAPDAATWAGHLGDGAKFLAPVKIGDTMRVLWRVESARTSKSKPKLGIMRLGFQIINQRDEGLQEGYITVTRGARGNG